MAELRVTYYHTAEGNAPFSRWFSKLRDSNAQARIDARIARLRSGNWGDCNSVGRGVIELRIDYGPGYRIYLAKGGRNTILLLCGGDKTSQTADIERAKDYLANHKSRKDANK